MSNLVLELRQGEVMIVNGAPIRFRTRSRIELTAKARFLFGKQIMPPDQVDSPARRIYFALRPVAESRLISMDSVARVRHDDRYFLLRLKYSGLSQARHPRVE